MIENLKESPEEFKDYDSELLLKILNKTSLENKKIQMKLKQFSLENLIPI